MTFLSLLRVFHRNFSSSNNTVNVVDSYFDLSNSFTCSQDTCICDKKLKIIVIMIIILIQPVQRVVGFCCTLSKRGCDFTDIANSFTVLLQVTASSCLCYFLKSSTACFLKSLQGAIEVVHVSFIAIKAIRH